MKFKKMLCCIILTCYLLPVTRPCKADLLKDIKNTVGDALETGWRATTAPHRVLINTGRVITGSARPSQIIQPYQRLGTAAGNTLQGANQFIVNPQREIYQRVQKAIADQGGKAGEFVFDVGTFNQRLQLELGSSTNNAVANVLRGQNPLQLVAVPLAGAIRAARSKHIGNSKPLPKDVHNALGPHFAPQVLTRARYVVGSVDITLPNFIGKGAKFMGHDFAVVVDDVIVFSKAPPTFAESPHWWAHEVTHVEQYGQVGVEVFAFHYVRDLGASIERAADARASHITHRAHPAHHVAHHAYRQIGVQVNQAANGHTAREFFILQCFFVSDQMPIHRMVTNTGKLIIVDPATGNWLHAGWATPKKHPAASWTYQTQRGPAYDVLPDGLISYLDQFGRPVKVGHVVRLQ